MYNTRYLPENFDQCRLEKTILRQFPYNLSVRSSWNALIQDGGNTMKRLIGILIKILAAGMYILVFFSEK